VNPGVWCCRGCRVPMALLRLPTPCVALLRERKKNRLPILNPKEVPRQRLPQATVCHSTRGGHSQSNDSSAVSARPVTANATLGASQVTKDIQVDEFREPRSRLHPVASFAALRITLFNHAIKVSCIKRWHQLCFTNCVLKSISHRIGWSNSKSHRR